MKSVYGVIEIVGLQVKAPVAPFFAIINPTYIIFCMFSFFVGPFLVSSNAGPWKISPLAPY